MADAVPDDERFAARLQAAARRRRLLALAALPALAVALALGYWLTRPTPCEALANTLCEANAVRTARCGPLAKLLQARATPARCAEALETWESQRSPMTASTLAVGIVRDLVGPETVDPVIDEARAREGLPPR